ncbi:MAG: DUF2332 family protein [Phenylobacterium sp.]|uniref:DUF2332 domain-containing protein n=1 Tax=Phenylobacterium sp. TaxID=1871053 RepID=UPI0025D7754A|nr:DUF2332 family protein [Phenylobacterium sp.]MBI1200011.1 DUF2332 family protein [Phenylobacterium sp.]
MSDDPIPGALRLQAGICKAFGAPFHAAMMERLAADYEQGGPTRGLVEPWIGASARKLFDDAVPIRLANAFTHLAMSGEAPALAAAYPTEANPAGDPDAAWGAARSAMTAHRDHLLAFMGHEPQTNEVRRSACLLGGFLTVAAETGLPLRCFEIGASAGLNVLWDRFHYRLGAAEWGDPASPVEIPTDWEGPLPPLEAKVEVAERAACDRRPTELTDPAQRRRLLACIWPGQFDRLARSRAAIDLALAGGTVVDEADALDWTRAKVRPEAGAATVLYHSIFWQYLPHETREALEAAILEIGDGATPEAPFAWLRMEPPMNNLATVELRLTLWPGGGERVLAEVHPHGAWVRWS